MIDRWLLGLDPRQVELCLCPTPNQATRDKEFPRMVSLGAIVYSTGGNKNDVCVTLDPQLPVEHRGDRCDRYRLHLLAPAIGVVSREEFYSETLDFAFFSTT